MAALAAALLVVTGCESNADKVSDNLSKEAEKFSVQRKIVGINGITDKVLFSVEGRCSIEGDGLGSLKALIVICKHGENDYRKHYIGIPDNVSFISTQVKGIKVSEYRTKIVLRPQALVPDIDLITGSQTEGETLTPADPGTGK
jgi:hypothetical protein